MRIVVIGGTGLIGSRVVTRLVANGHDVVAASPRRGVDTISGVGVAEALEGATVVVDVSNSPDFGYATALAFFERSTHNLLAAERRAGVGHHVALSVVGTQDLWQLGDPTTTTAGYFRAKQTQEEIIASSGIPYSIVHATQFFEFIGAIADVSTMDGVVRVPPVRFQPMAADDVAAGVAAVAIEPPVRGIVEIAGPEQFAFEEPVRRVLAASQDPREVVSDAAAGYFGIAVDDQTLVPGEGARLGATHLEDWLRQQAASTRTAAA